MLINCSNLLQVSQTGDNPTKITIKTVENTVKAASAAAANSGGGLEVPSASGSQEGHGHHREHHHHQRPSRKRKHKEFASPTGDALIHVDINDVDENGAGSGALPVVPPIASSSSSSVFSSSKTGTVQIQFDPNTKRLWQDLHYAYGNYASFLRHLILLEKYWRNGDLILSDNASQKASGYIR